MRSPWSDWRLPTVDELYTVANLAGNPLYLPDEFDTQWLYVWSSEGYDRDRALSFSYYPVYYNTNPVATFDKTYPLACRCVHDPVEVPEQCFNEEDLYAAYTEGLNGSTCIQDFTQEDLDEAFNNGFSLAYEENPAADEVLSVNTNEFKIETKHNKTTVDLRLISTEFEGAEGETQLTVFITLSDGRIIELNGSVELNGKSNKNRFVWKK